MSKSIKIMALVISSIMAMVLVAACSSRFVPQRGDLIASAPPAASISGPTNGLMQTDAGGSVTIDVEWDKTGDSSLSFNVAMNTHSVNLDEYDLGKLALLRDDAGNEYHPASWNSAPGGHHRRGVLIFPLPESVKEGKATFLELVVRDMAGVQERVLKWEL